MSLDIDYYELLEVERTADDKTLKSAYRKLAMQYHPDKNPGCGDSEARFKAINEAYDCLKDPQKRAAYDRFGKEGVNGAGGFGGAGGADFGDIGDIFESIFGSAFGGRQQQRGPARGADLRYDMEIKLEDAFTGCSREIQVDVAARCDACDGSGAKPGTSTNRCSTCAGHGKVRAQQGFFMVERTCPTCQGAGEVIADPCHSCHGEGRVDRRKTLTVTIPPGVDEGTRIRLSGEGESGARGAAPGDLYIFLHMARHKVFEREGTTLFTRAPISFTTAALGGCITIPGLDGKKHEIAIPTGIQSGKQLRQRGAGMPVLNGRGHGDLVVQIDVETPTKLSAKQKELLQAFRETETEVVPAAASAAEPAKKPVLHADGVDGEKVSHQSIRVNVDTLEQLMTMVSELVLTRNQLLEISRRHQDTEFKVPLQRLSNVTAELQEGVMKTRMQPIGNAWQKLPRIVRDLASELGKQIELEMHGAETELDRQVLDLIKDPLTHMVRNCADHGLETPAERLAAGKPQQGSIRLSAYHEGGHIIICIADNGRGLNTARIRAKALSLGLAAEAELEAMTEAQIHKFVFAPGFSTAATITSISGRGVGMDVVRSNIDQIGGVIDIKSVQGEGTSITVKIPLTLAIVSALIVEAGGERFAIPQLAVVELVRTRADSEHRIERIKDTAVLRLRNKLLPLVHLEHLLKLGDGGAADDGSHFIVVMQVGGQTFGVVVGAVFHTEEIVIKPMSTRLRHIGMFSGNTILGDGAVIMILDPNGIAQALGAAAAIRHGADAAETAAAASREARTSLLVFRAGSPVPKAVPLELVTRLEEIAAERIEFSNGRHMVQYRGHLMPLVRMEGVSVRDSGRQAVLVFTEDDRSMGLAVDEIVDIVEERLEIEVASGGAGMLGSAIVKGQATEVIDVGHFLPMAFADWFTRKEMRPSVTARSVLLVDDSAFFRNMLAPVLKAAGYQVRLAGGAREGLGLLRSGEHVDVILTDIEMPEMDGFEFAEAVRADAGLNGTPIIALSSMVSPAAIERGRQAGFYDYVAKFDRPGLIAALKEQTADSGRAAA